MSLLDYYTEEPDTETKIKLRQLVKVAYSVIEIGQDVSHFKCKTLRMCLGCLEKDDATTNSPIPIINIGMQKRIRKTINKNYVTAVLKWLIAKGYLEREKHNYKIIDVERLENDYWKLLGMLTRQI